MYIYIYLYICICVYINIHAQRKGQIVIHICIYIDRERERRGGTKAANAAVPKWKHTKRIKLRPTGNPRNSSPSSRQYQAPTCMFWKFQVACKVSRITTCVSVKYQGMQ